MEGGDGINQRNKKLAIVGIICVMLMCISGVCAIASGANSSENVFSTGSVDVELKQYFLDENNNKVQYEGRNMSVIPAQEINLIEQIENNANNCYVRAKISLTDNQGQEQELNIIGMPEGWQKIGEYYYYIPELGIGNEVNIFEKFIIPSNLQNGTTELTLQVDVDAVQASNFAPNYNADDPWNNIEIQKSIRNNYEFDTDTNKTTVEYENGANKYIKVPADLLKSFEKMMPGDNRNSILTIENTDKKSVELFLNAKTDHLTNEQKALLSRVNVKITKSNGEVVYEGNIAELSSINLGKYGKGEGEKLLFSIQTPADLQNEFAGINPSIIWKFSAKYENESNPKTGDIRFDLSLILFFAAAIGLIVVLVLMRAGKDK